MDKYRELDSLLDELGINEWENETKPKIINQLELVYNNLSETHPRKGDLKKYIDFFKYGEESGIDFNEFIEIYNTLKQEGIIKDNSGEELWRNIQENKGNYSNSEDVVDISSKRIKDNLEE